MDIHIENIRVGSLVDGLKTVGFVKWRGLKLEGALFIVMCIFCQHRPPGGNTAHHYYMN